MPTAPVPIGGGAFGEVTSHIDFVTQLASNAVNDVTDYIDQLNDLLDSITAIPSVPGLDNIDLQAPGNINFPAKPALPSLSVALPELPSFPALSDLPDVSISAKPDYTAGDAPDVDVPPIPGPLTATAPGDITVETDWTYPDAPTTSLPSVPTLETLSLPTVPTITLPTFSETLPSTADIADPGLNFAYDEDIYTSTLLTDVGTLLVSRLSGGTGLPAAIELAIWNRARDREEQSYKRTKNQILIENASRGFTRPQGTLTGALQDAAQEVQGKYGDLNRDIAIKQAELELKNLESAIAQSIQLETLNVNRWGDYYGRTLEAQKLLQQAILDVFQAKVARTNLELQAYTAYAQAFETRLKAALADLDIYKTQIEAQALIGQINEQSIKVYLGQLEGIKTEVDIFRTKVDAINTQVNTERLKIENLKAQIDAFLAQVNAKTSEYGLWESRLKGAFAPLDVYSKKVESYATRIDAYGKEADAETKVLEARIAQNAGILDRYKTQLQGVLGKTESITKQYEVDARVYSSATDMYRADVGAEGERYRAEATYNKAAADIEIAEAQLQIQNSQIAIKSATDQLALATEIIKKQSDIGSQLAASALSSLSIGAKIGSDTSMNWNYGFALDETNL